jgi:hypothetical protein
VARLAGRTLGALGAAAVCAAALCGCASTLQDRPIPHNILEDMVLAPYPVYWVGGSFAGMPIGEATHDPSNAWSVQYGNCLEGGEVGCVPALRIVTSPDNSFLPGGTAPSRTARIRGVNALLLRAGRTLVLATAGVVIDIYATSARTALAAARTAVPINALGKPEAPLPAPLPNTGYSELPLPDQVPSPLRALP